MLKTYLKSKYCLTEKEIEVLIKVTQGYTNNEMAKDFNLSVHTIKIHISSLLRKFDVEDRVSLAVKAVKSCYKNDIEI